MDKGSMSLGLHATDLNSRKQQGMKSWLAVVRQQAGDVGRQAPCQLGQALQLAAPPACPGCHTTGSTARSEEQHNNKLHNRK
jgi:hypothetical protein